MSRESAITREEELEKLFPRTCKSGGTPLELECLKESSEKEILDKFAINYSMCNCTEYSNCSNKIGHENAVRWCKCIEGSNHQSYTQFDNGIKYNNHINCGYVLSLCGCRVIFPCTQVLFRSPLILHVNHPFSITCEGKIFVGH